MTIAPAQWRPRAQQLADQLATDGYLATPGLYDAFARTPRHVFTPTFHLGQGESTGPGALVDATDPSWLGAIYRDASIITQYKLDVTGQRWVATSSSSQPSLMADMINELDIKPDHHVLEVGTGTGYNAAILSCLVGDHQVTTIDIDPELQTQAHARLVNLGHHVHTTPHPNTYDRILATHAVTHIPSTWVAWARPGALILADIRATGGMRPGAWVKLTVDSDRATATGRVMPARGGFMNARDTVEVGDAGLQKRPINTETLRTRTTTVPATVLDNPHFAFFAWWHIPDLEWYGAAPDHTNVYGLGGRFADVRTDGRVTYTLFADVWQAVEHVHTAWTDAGKPTMSDLTVTATDDGRTVLDITDTLE